jgi:hypothetical protein
MELDLVARLQENIRARRQFLLTLALLLVIAVVSALTHLR